MNRLVKAQPNETAEAASETIDLPGKGRDNAISILQRSWTTNFTWKD
jgi:hypothetical protein